MAEIIRLDPARTLPAPERPCPVLGAARPAAARRSFLERSACDAGFRVCAGLAATLIAATWLMSMLAAQACAATLWCAARR
jgi:hypothetical protein